MWIKLIVIIIETLYKSEIIILYEINHENLLILIIYFITDHWHYTYISWSCCAS